MTDSNLVALAKSLDQLPAYILSYISQTLIAIFTDFTATTLLLGAIAVWLAVSVWWGIAVFLLGFATAKIVNSIANAVGLIAQVMAQVQAAQLQAQATQAGRTMVVSGDASEHS